ncbi:MAG: DNA polymerase, partial [Bacillota bacterium]
KILEYRTVAKLKSTYVDGLTPLINPNTGKLHTTFNQAVTATGRLSSTAPNLQNIPIRLEEGRRLRRVFVPHQADWVIVGADYSQIELRVLAHIAQDEKFIEAFRQDQDIHRRTASEVFGIPFDQVTREQRDRAKAVNFGIVYGISDYGLGTNLGISRAEAKQYITSFFERYPRVRDYQEAYIAKARQDGYVTTLLNRRRYLPDINSRNFNQRSFAERTAINTPIQGSAADIIKLAMVRMDKILKERKLVGRMLLQVHDELICECPRGEQDAMQQALREAMEQAIELSVPLKVDVNVGSDWYSLK